MLSISPTKKYKCQVCKTDFVKSRPLQYVCGFECAMQEGSIKAAILRVKNERKDTQERKARLLTRSDWIKRAQVAFNTYIRARDAKELCISCGKLLQAEAVGGGFDCGHYRSVGSAPHLRFNDHNAHGQCKQCNLWKSGNAVDYRLGLIQRIGLANVDILEADQCLRKYTIEGLMEIVKEYRVMTKELQA